MAPNRIAGTEPDSSPAASPPMRWLRAFFDSGRPQLAFKAALAAGTAWMIAPYMPGSANEYPYYAPLGAVVAMYPTVAGSVRQGVETLLGLLMGIALAFLVLAVPGPVGLTVALAIGLGVLLAGLPGIGAGREWVPVAALFVLVLGGRNADEFSFGYALQMLAGVAVGVAVNFLVFPPLHFSGAVKGIEQLRGTLARQLSEMGAAMSETWPPRHEDWAARESRMSGLSRDVRAAVEFAESSRRGNLRWRLQPRSMAPDFSPLGTLERVAFYVEDMTEVVSGVIWRSPKETPVPLPLSEPLAAAMTAVGEAVGKWDDDDALSRAEAAVEDLRLGMNATASVESPVDATGSLVLSLRRILRALGARALDERTGE